MIIYNHTISVQDIPNEITLCFNVCGCNIKCKDCHSKFLWNTKNGNPLDLQTYVSILNKYDIFISAVCFFGGEWNMKELVSFLKIAKDYNKKTALYTGLDDIDKSIKDELTFLKTGRFIKERGGLENPLTNQIMTNLKTGEILNWLFQK